MADLPVVDLGVQNFGTGLYGEPALGEGQGTMERWTWVRTAGALLAVALVAACSQGGHTAKPPTGRSPSPPPAEPSGPSAEDRIAAHRQQVLAQYATGKDAPDDDGLSVAGSGPGGTLFFWSTADDRYCAATYFTGGASTSACPAGAEPISGTPRLTRLYEGAPYSLRGEWGVFVAADRETIESVRCGSTPVTVREVRGVQRGDARRTVYAMELDRGAGGTLTVRVRRAGGSATVRLPLAIPAHDVPRDSGSWQVCATG
ncbi:hypothetical protein [Streptomyces aquilus]|uniref:hypothetical protein n=1 Tax=Streptomyces aquilus TaxID=2548456 RepID=UPI00367C93D5